MMKRPLFSCVMPVKGSRPYMEEALESLTTQDMGDELEVIVQDGDIEPDAGQSDALNKGFAKASGEWFFWLNADDVLLPGALKKVRNKIIELATLGCAVEWIAGDTVYIDEKGLVLDVRTDAKWRPWFGRNLSVWTGGPSSFFRKNLWVRSGGFDTGLKYVMDIDLWTRWARGGCRFICLNEYVWGFRWHIGSRTSNTANVIEHTQERTRVLKIHGLKYQAAWRFFTRLVCIFDGSFIKRVFDTKRFKGRYWAATMCHIDKVNLYQQRYFRPGQYFVCYVDLLGQKDLYSGLPSSKENLTKTDFDRIRSICSVVNKIHGYAKRFLLEFIKRADESYARQRSIGVVKYLSMNLSDYEKLVSKLEFGGTQFSDSMIFYLRDDEKIAGDIFSFYVALLCRLAMEYFPNRISFRGAITYGRGWESGCNCIAGGVLADVINLEERIAVVPRIVVGEKLVKYCNDARPVKKSEWKSAKNLAFTMMESMYKDIDGNYALDLWGILFKNSLMPNEFSIHRDLLIAACKYAYDQYSVFKEKTICADVISQQCSAESVTFKFAMAFDQLRERATLWGAGDIDYSSKSSGYLPAPDNYSGAIVDIHEYILIRAEIDRLGADGEKKEIEQTKRINRALRILLFAIGYLRRNSVNSTSFIEKMWSIDDVMKLKKFAQKQVVIMQQIGNAAIIGIKKDGAFLQFLKWILYVFSLQSFRLMKDNIFVKGSVVNGLGWLVAGNVINGPVMQKSYESIKKLSISYRWVVDKEVGNYLGWREKVHGSVFNHAGNIGSRLVKLGFDGVRMIDFIAIVACLCKWQPRRQPRYIMDIKIAVAAMRKIIPNGYISGRNIWGYYMVVYAMKNSVSSCFNEDVAKEILGE